MFSKARVVSAVTLSLAFSMSASPTLAELRGPAERPPAGFTGQQYVDSRGCVFLRAGYGGNVTWVPRVTRDRKQMCGLAASRQKVEVAAEPSPAAVVPVPKPSANAPLPAEPASVRAAAVPAVSSGPAEAPVRPPAAAPAPVASSLPSAGQPASVAKSLPPAVASVPATGLAADPCAMNRPMATHDGRVIRISCGAARPSAALSPQIGFEPPPGYKPAWEDDRLNPYRALRTAEGDAAMYRIWTETVPAELRPVPLPPPAERVAVASAEAGARALPPRRARSAALRAPKVVPGQGGPVYVQVGAFGVPANAEKAAGRLVALGLPVARGKAKGGRLQLVLVGPFISAEEAEAALRQARSAGFRDAFYTR